MFFSRKNSLMSFQNLVLTTICCFSVHDFIRKSAIQLEWFESKKNQNFVFLRKNSPMSFQSLVLTTGLCFSVITSLEYLQPILNISRAHTNIRIWVFSRMKNLMSFQTLILTPRWCFSVNDFIRISAIRLEGFTDNKWKVL